MGLKWKMQHINNGCASACFAMLLSHYGIDKEDFEVIEETYMPFLVYYDIERDIFRAGVMMQNHDTFNNMSKKYHLEFVESKCSSWDIFFEQVSSLLKNNNPFMTGIAKGFIPSKAYDEIRKTNNKSGGHTIVIYKKDNNLFWALDPSGGLDRSKGYQFADVKELVEIKINSKQLKEGIESKEGKRFLIGYLRKSDSFDTKSLDEQIEISRKAMLTFKTKMHNFKTILSKDPETNNYRKYMKYVFNYIKPITMDFRNAVEAIKNKTDTQKILISKLKKLQQITISCQRNIKRNGVENDDYFAELASLTDLIHETILCHLNSLSKI
ncbi:hypothetical protein ES703_10081 [subsurface metagenome]